MATTRIEFTTPVGRLVGGSLYKPKTTDQNGQPRIIKNGPNKGQPHSSFDFGVAIPKGGEQHWSQTAWGQIIWGEGNRAFPQFAQHPTFAWKITDGDATSAKKPGGKIPREQTGYAGHWVLWFSSGSAPQIWNANGSQRIVEEDAVKLGYYVQVFGSVAGNGSTESPGVYLNHSMVALSAYGEVIQMGPDVAAAGFGNGVALPPGASATPPAGFSPPAAAGAPLPAAQPASVPVMPQPGFVAGAGAAMPMPPAVAAPVAPPAAPVHQMTPKAQGASYESFVSQGWTDALLREHGYML